MVRIKKIFSSFIIRLFSSKRINRSPSSHEEILDVDASHQPEKELQSMDLQWKESHIVKSQK